jgi:hypothetical protein
MGFPGPSNDLRVGLETCVYANLSAQLSFTLCEISDCKSRHGRWEDQSLGVFQAWQIYIPHLGYSRDFHGHAPKPIHWHNVLECALTLARDLAYT